MVCETVRDWYHSLVNRVNSRSSSRLLCQVVVLNAMKPRRLSPRVILQISIWSLVVIMLAFILLYSFLLTYMNRHVMHTPVQDSAVLQWENTHSETKHTHNSRKVKFRSKGSGNFRLHNIVNTEEARNTHHFSVDSHRKVVWNSSDYFDVFSARPDCPSNSSLLTILITSSPEHFERRAQIRQTWCSPSASAQPTGAWHCIFLIGQTSKPEVDNAVNQEANNFHDILRGTYIDSYRNLTYKVLHGLSWNSKLCPTSFTLKTDDDCFVNTVQLYLFLQHTNREKTKLYVGNVNHILQKRKVVRNKDSRWAVSVDMYAPDYYPPYASGTGYVLTQDMVQMIVSESQYIMPIPNEDAYIGIVVESLGVEPVTSSRFTLFSLGLRLCNYIYVLVSHSVKAEDHRTHHDNMMKALGECSRNTKSLLNTWS